MMSVLSPRGMHDMTGWHRLTCTQADEVFARHRELPHDVFNVASSLTDPGGVYGSPVIFTEWWFDGMPLLRDYRRMPDRPCEHYGAMDATAAIEKETDDAN